MKNNMILSTEKLFSNIRHSPKRKYKIYHKSKLSAPIISINDIYKNEINIKHNPIFNTISHDDNPFIKTQFNQLKNCKNLCSKGFPKKTNSEKFKEIYFKKASLTNEFNFNKIKSNIGIRNRKKSQNDI